MSEALDQFIAPSETALGVAKGSFNRSRDVLFVLRQQGSEDKANNGESRSKD